MDLKPPILAIDYGDRRIGLAISDAFHWTARPLLTIDQKQTSDVFAVIREVVLENDVGEIVIGLPLNMDGTHGEAAEKIEKFATELKTCVDCPILFEDERLTSAMAQDIMIETGKSKKAHRNKAKVDQMAAALILQSYMSRKNSPPSRSE